MTEEYFLRCGVSQQLGRFMVKVAKATRNTASIEITSEDGSISTYFVTLETSDAFSLKFDSWHDWAARAAIAQSAKRKKKSECSGNYSEVLDHGIAPWVGDLVEERYGGATIGVHMQLEAQVKNLRDASDAFSKTSSLQNRVNTILGINPSSPSRHSSSCGMEEKFKIEERRDTEVADRRQAEAQFVIVERGVELQRSAGDTAAVAFMLGNRIPQHVLLRVLSCSSFRRKATASSCRRSRDLTVLKVEARDEFSNLGGSKCVE